MRARNPLDEGSRWGKWEVIQQARNRGTHRYYVCKCVCGTHAEVREYTLLSATQDAGCRHCVVRDAARTHGGTQTFEFRAWTAMKRRCNYKKHPAYALYGGRGITICAEWLSFAHFLADMGPCPYGAAGSVDRIDNDLGYNPSNCVWAPRSEQAKHRRTVPLYDGLTMPDLAAKLGVKYTTLRQRIAAGWDPSLWGKSPVELGTRRTHNPTQE